MNRYEQTFQQLETEGRIAFIPFWMIGDPNPEESLKVIDVLAQEADILELGLPFSDPLADGPTIQAAVNRSIESGTNTQKCFQIIKNIRDKYPEKPIGLLVYLNLVMQFGIENFFIQCKQNGVDSVLVPELPVEEVELVKSFAQKNNIHLVFLLSTNTPAPRKENIFNHSGGFVYMVSTPSITGAKTILSPETLSLVASLKTATTLPICVGFGISTPDHIRALKKAGANGAIIGSELINIYQKKDLESLKTFCQDCVEATKP